MLKDDIAIKYNLNMDDHYELLVINALIAIEKYNMKTWFIEFDEEDGFMWSNHKNISILHQELSSDMHSGCSAAVTLRKCQQILRKEYNTEQRNKDDSSEDDIIIPLLHTEPIPYKSEKNKINDSDNNSSDEYLFYEGMDDNNKKAYNIFKTKGTDKAIEHMFKHPETGKPLSYSEMRSFYG